MSQEIKILYIEDSLIDQDLTVRQLKKSSSDFRVTLTDTLVDARKRLSKSSFDVVLLDYQLPDGEGVELLDWISFEKIDVGVIMITARSDAEFAVRALKSGADDYIQKKSDYLRQLPGTIHSLLARRRKRQSMLKHPGKVLICGNNKLLNDDFRPFLLTESTYLDVCEVNSGKIAIDHITQDTFDSIIVASNLQDITVFDFIKKIKNIPSAPLVILYLLNEDRELYTQADKIGCFECVFASDDSENVSQQLISATERAVHHKRLATFASALEESDMKMRLMNHELQLQNSCYQAIITISREQDLMEKICRLVVQKGGFRMAWIGICDEEAKRVRPVACAGEGLDYLDGIQITWGKEKTGRGPTGMAIRTGRPVVSCDTGKDITFVPWRENAEKHGFSASYALPLKDEKNRPFGALNVYSARPNAGAPGEVNLLESVANNLAYAINAIRSGARRQQAEEFSVKKIKELEAVNIISKAVSANLDLDRLLDSVKHKICKITDSDLLIVYLVADNQFGLLKGSVIPLPLQENTEFRKLTWKLASEVVSTGLPFFYRDNVIHETLDNEDKKMAGIQSFCALPLIAEDQVESVLILGSRSVQNYRLQLSYLETIASQIAIALKNGQLLRQSVLAAQELQKQVETINKTQAQVQKSKLLLERVFDGIAEPLMFLDQNMTIKMMNRSAANYYGVDLAGSIGEKCFETFSDRLDMCDGCFIGPSLKESKHEVFERTGLMDSSKVEEVSFYLAKEIESDSVGAIVRICDITEAKMLQKQLIHNEKLSSLGLLVSGIAHEISNPNNFITFNTPLLKNYISSLFCLTDDLAEKNEELTLLGLPYSDFRQNTFDLLEYIGHGSDRISATVKQLKGFVESKNHNETVPVDIHKLVARVVNLCRGEFKTFGEIVDIQISDEIISIFTDPNIIEQVLVNLLINAIHSLDKDEKSIQVTVRFHQPHPSDITIEIRDNGGGMTDNEQLRIFDPFYTTKESGKGTGLGLYVCYSLISGIGGEINVSSILGKGSVFTVVVPEVIKEDMLIFGI